jgi:hypothetical protein
LSADFLDSQDTFAESAIKTAGGTVQVTGTTTNSGTGVDITGVKISSKTGNITIEGDTGSFSTAVSVGPSSRNAQIVSEIASSAPSVQIIGDGSIKLLNGTKVKKTKDASDPTTLLVQAGDDISIDTKVEISSDGGVLNVDLDAGHDASGSISIASGTTIKTRGGSVTLHSSADADVHGAEFIRMFGQDGRIDIDTRLTGSDTDKTGGEVTLLADGQRQIFGLEGGSPARIHLDNVDIKSASGNVTLTSRAQPKANGATEGVALLSSTITTTQGKISIDSAAEQIAIGVRIAANSAQSATSALNTGSGDISIRGTAGSADHPIVLPSIGVAIGDPETPSLKPTIMTTGGKIEIIGVAGSSHQQSIGVQIVDANVNSATSLTVDGTAQGEITRGEGFYAGVQILSTTLTSGSGVLLIRGTGHDGSQGVDGKPGSQSDGVLPGEDGESGGFGASGVVIDHSTITASSEISIEGTGGRGGDGGQGGAGWNNDSSTGVGGDAGSGGSGGHGGSGIDVSNSTLSAQSKIAMDGKGGAGGNGGPGGVGGAGNNGGGGGFPEMVALAAAVVKVCCSSIRLSARRPRP